MKYTKIRGDVVRPRMSVTGYIKVGGKERRKEPRWSKSGPYLLPQRYVNPTRFEIVTREHHIDMVSHSREPSRKFKLDRGYRRDAAIHKRIGDMPTELKVRLYFPLPEQNFVSFLGWYDGRKWACTGDGEQATEVGPKGEVSRPCPCDRLGGKDPQAGICKPQGNLSVWLEGSGQWGLVHMFKTTSWESIGNIRTQLDAFYKTFGTLAWLPLILKVYPATKTYKDPNGKRASTTQPIVTLATAGEPTAALKAAERWSKSQDIAAQIAGPGHVEMVKEEMASEAQTHGDEFFPESRLLKEAPPPRRAASRLAQITKGAGNG